MFNFFIYDNEILEAGFVSLCAATSYAEDYISAADRYIHVVDAHTGEIIDTWTNGAWENKRF